MNKFKFLLFLCVSVFISYSTTSSAAGLWESAKDGAVKQFAGCYKNSRLEYKECMKQGESGAKTSEARDALVTSCDEKSKNKLFECRLDKGKLKEGCTEEKLRKDLNRASSNVELACEKTCKDQCKVRLPDGPDPWHACRRACSVKCNTDAAILKEENAIYERCISTAK